MRARTAAALTVSFAVALLACAEEREDAPGEMAHGIHPPGISDPDSDDFHGTLLRETAWDFARCAECHGEDFGGGAADSSCLTCHEEGPTACSTCHDADLLESGAHAAHVDESTPLFEQCETCHLTPPSWDTPGHILVDGEVDPAPAEVRLSGLAEATQPGGERAEPPTFDADTRTCSAVYCHGGTLDDPAALRPEPRWDGGDGDAFCGSCHGTPPADHAQDECATCHSTVIAAGGTFVAPELHIDAIVQVGDEGAAECTGCHGSTRGPAPPPDLTGGTDTSLVTVGAHRAHLEAPHRLRGPIACEDCHVVPATITAPGHIDSELPAEVFPGGAAFSGLAAAGGAAPSWDRETATCADVYCHGGGSLLAGDGAPGLVREPVWTLLSAGQASCGACHGIPPIDATHAPDLALGDCVDCHTSVDAFGNILLTGPPTAPLSEHMDGDIDVR